MIVNIEPISPIGISLPGFFVSSPNVATPSNPTYAKKRTAEAFKIPWIPNGAKFVVKLVGLTLVMPATKMKIKTTRWVIDITELNLDEAFMLKAAPKQTKMEIKTAIGSKWLKLSERDDAVMRKSLGLWLHNVAKYEVHDLATLAPEIIYSKRRFPAAI